MTGSIALDVVIGLIFIYLLYSLLATIIQEILAVNVLKLRSKVLEIAIQRMLDDHTGNHLLSEAFYDTPLIKYLAEKDGRKPAYLVTRNFSRAILDLLKGEGTKPGDDFRVRIDQALDKDIGISVSASTKLNTGESFKFLQSLWADAQGDIEKFRKLLEEWFDDTMERASGWYKRKTQFILFFVGFTIAVIFNVDTVEIIHKLSSDPKLTAQLVQQADNFAKAHPNLDIELKQQKDAIEKLSGISKADSLALVKSAEENYIALKEQQDALLSKADSLLKSDIKNVNGILGLGIHSYVFRGKNASEVIGWFLLSLVGWLLTALALSLGAPFWFDLLNKLMRMRTAVAATSDSRSSGSPQDVSTKKTITIKG